MFKNYVKVHRKVFHFTTPSGVTSYNICAWYIQNISTLKAITSWSFEEKVKGSGPYYYCCEICPDPKGKILLKHSCEQNHSISAHCYIYCAFIEGEDFQKLKELPDSTAVIICRMEYLTHGEIIPEPPTTVNSEYINSLKAELKQYSGTSSKEMVSLCVGEATERVNKAILCIQSPVFAKMFENDMKELKDNTVTITDIKMPVLRVLVSFLCSGLLPKCDFDLSCQLYYVADKYDIKDLRLACIALLTSKASLGNLLHLLKLSLSHSDELLKSVAMTLIRANIKEITLTPDWKNFMLEEPVIALEAATFFVLK